MAAEMVSQGDALVVRSVEYPHRWYDVFGPNVVKYNLNTAAVPTDDATGMPSEFTNTLVGASTFAHTDVLGGGVIMTAEALENDGVKLQLGDELGGAGENVSFATRYPTYFGVKFQVNDADQTDVLFGFCVTDTACLDAVADGIYFRSVDESALLYFVLEQDSVESVTAVATLTDAADVVAEFLYDTDGNIDVYINGALAVTIADTDANFCNDELLRLTIEFLSGAAAANTCTVKWLRFAQIQN
jgi:hypothetical protein